MIIPTKHIHTRRSLLNIGAEILQRVHRSRSVTALWDDMHYLPEVGTFQRFSLALALLYALGGVEFQEGLLRRPPKNDPRCAL